MIGSNDDFLSSLKEQLRKEKYLEHGICECCGEVDPFCLKIYEQDHIDGKAYSDREACLCLNCHKIKTEIQNSVAPQHRKRQIPLKERILYVLLSHSSLRKRMEEIELRLIKQLQEVMKNEEKNSS